PTVQYLVGSVNSSNAQFGLINPLSIASADFNHDFLPDLAVGASNGVGVLLNTSVGNVVGFNNGGSNPPVPVIGLGGQVTALATGNIAVGVKGPDIAALVSGATPSVSILANDGTGNNFTTTRFANSNVAADS